MNKITPDMIIKTRMCLEMTQPEFGRTIGYSVRQICRLEKGESKPRPILKYILETILENHVNKTRKGQTIKKLLQEIKYG